MSARRAGTVAVGAVVVTTLLVVLLATWAASIGPGGVLRGDGPGPATESSASATPSTTQESEAEPPTRDSDSKHWWVRALAFLLRTAITIAFVALLLWLAGTLVARARQRARSRREHRQRLEQVDAVDFEPVAPPSRVAREMLADAGTQRQALLEGSPRNAVVACWHRFETQGASAGVERHSWETSSEYTMRLLELVDAHEPAVSRLGALYREARFSEHQLTEADRRAAVEALDAIHRAVGVRG